ncbi:Uma2 family endonuclease [Pontibacillus yanchengensis]|uniref:Putative restriction endonuclease domain-containing protein n=1 Tax=Pontibacillus yanchengensis Y32 TaxID=1385514 RepID=A0A0A2TJG7_9BACI|nr:Uma2 family endonuclease [Pontibacillus yanchengensis]KGP74221.1 hypothetical protein N782_09295 [Pontibacillus yanchengensis Y32]
MSLANDDVVTKKEFFQMREQTEELLEYIHGLVFMSPSPSTIHQRISSRLHATLFNALDGSECEVFPAPFDIELKNDEKDTSQIIIPDLSVICDKTGLNEQRFVGVPDVIIEIISPSNQSHDLVIKLNLYMDYGVKEYWIVNPLLNTIQLYILDEEGNYQQQNVVKDYGVVQSEVIKNFNVQAEELFSY